MSAPEASELSAIWTKWVEAYRRLRRLPLERMTHGWWLDVGKPQQTGRYFLRFADLAVLRQLAESAEYPAVHFEVPASRSLVEQILPDGWTTAAPEFLMTASVGVSEIPAFPVNYQFIMDADDAEIRVSCVNEEGHALSRGVCLISRTDAVFDQIVTEREVRRQGLATAIMAILAAAAADRGATRGLLLATEEGRPFYEALGWSVLSEVSKAISPAESRAVRHLRIVSKH